MTKSDKKDYQSIKLFDINVFSSDKQVVLNLLTTHLKEEKTLLTVMTPNPEQVVLSRSNSDFLHHLQSADLCLPDGVGLVIASKLVDLSRDKQSLTERISGKEVAAFLYDYALKNDMCVVVIGGREYGQHAAANGESKNEQLLQTPLHHQPFDKAFWLEGYADVQNPTADEESAITATLKRIKPAIVFVAFGAPWQEKWVIEHRALLESAGVRLAMVVGGAFDVLLGKIPGAPAFMSTLGLEWLYRLVQEPWRWRRQLKLLEFTKLIVQSI